MDDFEYTVSSMAELQKKNGRHPWWALAEAVSRLGEVEWEVLKTKFEEVMNGEADSSAGGDPEASGRG